LIDRNPNFAKAFSSYGRWNNLFGSISDIANSCKDLIRLSATYVCSLANIFLPKYITTLSTVVPCNL